MKDTVLLEELSFKISPRAPEESMRGFAVLALFVPLTDRTGEVELSHAIAGNANEQDIRHGGGRAMLKEFREFAMRGNLLDMAIGIVMGAAFGRIISSLVSDVIMPPIGLALGGLDFANLFFTLKGGPYPSVAAAKAAGAPTINYGIFINTVIDFVIVVFVIFLVIRQVNRMQRRPEAAPATKSCPYCLSVIPVGAVRCPNCTSDLRAA